MTIIVNEMFVQEKKKSPIPSNFVVLSPLIAIITCTKTVVIHNEKVLSPLITQ
jgi:hypothetical protein